ncbi:MAG: radical SAM protein [Aigarchaeota archaeon]|nr:radical SAM protein [Aigarchaeota archaeon]MDW8021899.1 radical SAM protein [Nitrososphaerota archaeon]
MAESAAPEARLYERIEGGVIRCLICERGCVLKDGAAGICRNYVNDRGRLLHLGYGLVSAVESRPIEVKPLFHYWPNSTALTFSGYGCNFYCPWCQNSHLSFSNLPSGMRRIPSEKLVKQAVSGGDEGLCASFNEPVTLFDYLLDLFDLGRKHGLYGVLVTNGYFTERALRMLLEVGVDGFSIDIKGCPSARGALTSIEHSKVFRNAKLVLDTGGYVEMVYLVVTGFNDSEECAEWIFEKHLECLGGHIPIHVNRYYPANFWSKSPTPLSRLLEFRDMALKMGIEYVYVGNVGIPELEATICPKCGKRLIARHLYRVTYYKLDGDKCPRCGHKITLRGRFIQK